MTHENQRAKKTNAGCGIILAVLMIAGIGFLGYWFIFSSYISTDNASIDGDHVSISAKMMGRIKSLSVNEGVKVEAGQLLVQLDDNDLRANAQYSIAQAQINTADAQLGVIEKPNS